jgi:hypothetical protein
MSERKDPFMDVLIESMDGIEESLELREDQKEMLHAAMGAILPFFYFGNSKEELDEFKKLHGIDEIREERFELKPKKAKKMK